MKNSRKNYQHEKVLKYLTICHQVIFGLHVIAHHFLSYEIPLYNKLILLSSLGSAWDKDKSYEI